MKQVVSNGRKITSRRPISQGQFLYNRISSVENGLFRLVSSEAISYTVGFRPSKTAVFDWPFFRLDSSAISYTVGFRQSKTDLFDWPLFRPDSSGPSYRQSSRYYIFCDLLRGGWCEGVLLLYGSRNRLAALCFAFSPRAMAQRTLVPASWWLWT